MPTRERGFTAIEVLIAGAIITMMALIGLAACKAVAAASVGIFCAGHDAAAVDLQAGRLRDDAASSFAVFVPTDVSSGAVDGATSGANEVDFYSKTADGQDIFWRYVYDPARQTLQRFDYDADGANGVRNLVTGRVDPAAAYPPLTAITAFRARGIAADQLGDPNRNLYSGVASVFAHAPPAFRVDYDRGDGDGAAATGGNAVVEVAFANATAARVIHLAAGTMPTGFTVTGLPRWHAILFRVDQTHRFLFGFAGKSHVFINARVDVTYDGWKHRTPWCIFNVLGDPDGLDPHDPHADYRPDEAFEQAESLLEDCRKIHPAPPSLLSAGNAPEPSVIAQTLPGPQPPPVCWSDPGPEGRCWPADAPTDWRPPAPLPVDTPPPDWCAAHAQSIACPPTPSGPA